MESLVVYLKCGGYTISRNHGVFSVTKLSDIVQIIIPLFLEHRIRGEKWNDFHD